MRTEYRVTWKREGNRPKSRRVAGLPTAQRWVGLLTSAEPWKFLKDTKDQGPEDFYCCNGYECGCGGLTVRQWCDEKRKDLPPIEYVRVQRREVTPWTTPEEDTCSPK